MADGSFKDCHILTLQQGGCLLNLLVLIAIGNFDAIGEHQLSQFANLETALCKGSHELVLRAGVWIEVWFAGVVQLGGTLERQLESRLGQIACGCLWHKHLDSCRE